MSQRNMSQNTSQDVILISKAELLTFASAIFVAAGCSRAHADEWANMLIWANLRGVDSMV